VKVIFASCIMLMDFTIFLKATLILFYETKNYRLYTEVTVRILFSLNFCPHDSYFFIPVINLITFF